MGETTKTAVARDPGCWGASQTSGCDRKYISESSRACGSKPQYPRLDESRLIKKRIPTTTTPPNTNRTYATMPYPQEQPKAKHDLWFVSNKYLEPSKEELVQATICLPKNSFQRRVAIYTFQQPCPLRQWMAMAGRLKLSLRRLDDLINASKYQSCVVGVKRSKNCVSEKDNKNSNVFSSYILSLRQDNAVGIIYKDKHGRIGFVLPFVTDKEDCAATCIIGEASSIIDLLLRATRQTNKKRKADDAGLHKNPEAEAINKKYSDLVRDLRTRGDSRLFHMRNFHGWVKAIQIQEANPQTKRTMRGRYSSLPPQLRVLDLACGKGGDLKKWVYHPRGMERYVGVDVALGSLNDAAERVQKMTRKPAKCTFICADLGADVLGQEDPLLSWSIGGNSTQLRRVPGGGVTASERFDVVSIQFAIHYMMSSPERARRFFRTVSELLEVGGEFIVTTTDARVILDHLMGSGRDLFFDKQTSNEEEEDHVITLDGGACRIAFKHNVVRRIFDASSIDDLFGLEYSFKLTEGSDDAAGVGTAVDLSEWLTPLPLLNKLAKEAGLELVDGQNFHEFYTARKDPQTFRKAHQSLRSMEVLNRNSSISAKEWEISRLYCCLRFKKVA